MGAGKNKSHRKKRISKHVLQAEERRKQTEVEKQLLSAAEGKASSTTSDDGVSKDETSAQKQQSPASAAVPSSSKTKDPEEASSYLTLWNYDRTNSTKQWKFNKNTQSWLLRHMYDFDKVSKTTFALLVEYLLQGGEGLKSRVEEEAKRRARRYKDWEKGQKKKQEDDGDDEKKGDGNEEKSNEKDKQSSSIEDDAETAWKGMDDHDKRKEYKRARKVLDTLKAQRDGTKTEEA